MTLAEVPGSARLVLVDGVIHLDEAAAVFEGMLVGWARQQKSRLLGDSTVSTRLSLLRRFADDVESYPWAWSPGDVEDFTVGLMSGKGRLAPSTIRGYHLTLRMFCDYLCDARYEWMTQCRGPLRAGTEPGVPRVEHRRPPQRLRGQPGPPALDLRRVGEPVRLPRRPGRPGGSLGPQGRVGGAARRPDGQDGLRVRVTASRAVPTRAGRSPGEPPRARMGYLRLGPRPLRQGHQGRRATPSHGARRPRVRLGHRRLAPVGRRGPTLARSRRPSGPVGHRAVASDLAASTSTNGSTGCAPRPGWTPCSPCTACAIPT